MTSVRDNIRHLHDMIARAAEKAGRSPDEVTTIAVTKTVEPELVREAFEAGMRHFGENRVQEANTKVGQLSDLEPAVTWHMVGHLQTNKVRAALGAFDVIHSIDSIRLAEAVNREAVGPVPVLLQVNVSGESSKSGFFPSEVAAVAERASTLPHLEVKGLMTIAPLTNDPEEVRPVFRQLRALRDSLGLEHLSMGMTDDFEVAVEEGATMIRIGRAIFGERRR